MTERQIRAELHLIRSQINNAYWTYTRTKRGKPPVMVVPHIYTRQRELNTALAEHRKTKHMKTTPTIIGSMPDRQTTRVTFSAPMILKILAGAKSMTRRQLNPQPSLRPGAADPKLMTSWEWPAHKARSMVDLVEGGCTGPYGARGDHLLVRETWRTAKDFDNLSPVAIGEKAIDAGYTRPWCAIKYEADGDTNGVAIREFGGEWGRKRACLHMPAWASRITLKITGVRIERLQDITAEDAIAEGASYADYGANQFGQGKPGWSMFGSTSSDECLSTPQLAFANAWNVIHGGPDWNTSKKPEPWSLNPFVWVISFARLS